MILDSDEPRFGEVWMWEDMGPFMVISLGPMDGTVNVYALTNDGNGLRLISMMWDQPGHTYREHWERIDTEELG